MYRLIASSEYRRNIKLLKKQGKDLNILNDVVRKLQNGEILPEKNRDHKLSGKYNAFRECHITPDWILIYKINEDELYLYLQKTGSHSGALNI